MPMLNESTTAVLIRGETVSNNFSTEPYEVGWAKEAIFFLYNLEKDITGKFCVQISPDGFNWATDENHILIPKANYVSFIKINHFGNWLKFVSSINGDEKTKIMATLHLKQ